MGDIIVCGCLSNLSFNAGIRLFFFPLLFPFFLDSNRVVMPRPVRRRLRSRRGIILGVLRTWHWRIQSLVREPHDGQDLLQLGSKVTATPHSKTRTALVFPRSSRGSDTCVALAGIVTRAHELGTRLIHPQGAINSATRTSLPKTRDKSHPSQGWNLIFWLLLSAEMA